MTRSTREEENRWVVANGDFLHAFGPRSVR
jgi:hypothetical protein